MAESKKECDRKEELYWKSAALRKRAWSKRGVVVIIPKKKTALMKERDQKEELYSGD